MIETVFAFDYASGVASGAHYPTPTHLHPAMTRAYGYRPGDFVRGEQIANHALSLPIFRK